MGKDKKTIGVLGGMGPYATLMFFEKLLDLNPVKKDWNNLHIVIDNNPAIPSRSRHFLFNEASPLPGMIDSCHRLENYPVDFIVIPCNSASYFLKDIQKEIKIPILNIMKVTSDAIIKKYPNASSVVVLGGVVTYESKTYLPYIENKGLKYVQHDKNLQRRVENLIELIKLNKVDNIANDFNILIDDIKNKYNVDVAILGCTEFACVADLKCSINLIDSSYELAEYTVSFAKL